jgi:hypothetical protein
MGLIYSIKQKEALATEVEQMAETIGSITPDEAGHITVLKELFNG